MRKLKSDNTAVSVKDDGATNLGVLLGTLIGAGMVYWRLAVTAQHHGMIIVLSVSTGAFLGACVGAVIGRWLMPRLEKAILNAADQAARHTNHGRKG
jgi:hypothetical protein